MNLERIGFVIGSIGVVLAALWLLEEFGLVDWLDSPGDGAIGFLLLGFVLMSLGKRKRAGAASDADPS